MMRNMQDPDRLVGLHISPLVRPSLSVERPPNNGNVGTTRCHQDVGSDTCDGKL
jgi:hypothetical protein